MKFKIKNIYLFLFIIMLLLSCEPRIGLDMDQWGDKAFLTNVQVFTLEADEHELQEYYESKTLTPALRRKIISSGNAVVDKSSYTAIVNIPKDVDLNYAGFIFYHQAKKIVPIKNSPAAGIITNLSEGNYYYTVISADGSQHEWTVSIQVK